VRASLERTFETCEQRISDCTWDPTRVYVHPSLNILENYAVLPAKVKPPLDTLTTVPPLFRNGRVPSPRGLLEKGVISLNTFHTRPGASHVLC